MATNITNLTTELNPINGNIVSITASGVTDRITRIRISISSPNNISTSMSGIVAIDTTIAVDANNQRPWEKEFSLDDDFFDGDLNCDDLLDITIEWLDDINGWTQEDNFPTQMTIDCSASQNCSITIEPIVIGVRSNPAIDSNMRSITIKGTAHLCNSFRIAITDDNNVTYQQTVNFTANPWAIEFQVDDISNFKGKYFTCSQSYTVNAECIGDPSCLTTQTVQLTCIAPCERFASLVLTQLSNNTQLSNPDILHCMPAGDYTIAVTDPPINDVLLYEWYKDDVRIPNETGRSIEIILGNQESSQYTVFVITTNGCTLQQDVVFSCDDGSQDCIVSDWSSWGPCINGIETRTRTIITPASNGGAPCPPSNELIETRNCSENDDGDVDCVVSDWIIGRCVNNQRTDTRTIIVQPANEGEECPPLTRTVKCRTNTPPDSTMPTLSCLMFKILALIGFGLVFLGGVLFACPALSLPIPPPASLAIAIGLIISGGILIAIGLSLWIFLCNPNRCDWLCLAWQVLILLAFVMIYAAGCPACIWMLSGVIFLIAGAIVLIIWARNCDASRCHVLVELISLFTFVINIVAVMEMILSTCVIASNIVASIVWGIMIAGIQAWLWLDLNRNNCIRLS